MSVQNDMQGDAGDSTCARKTDGKKPGGKAKFNSAAVLRNLEALILPVKVDPAFEFVRQHRALIDAKRQAGIPMKQIASIIQISTRTLNGYLERLSALEIGDE